MWIEIEVEFLLNIGTDKILLVKSKEIINRKVPEEDKADYH